MKRPSLRSLGEIGFLAAVAICVYALAYFLLMARNVPAVSQAGEVRFQSSFRFAAPAGRLGESSVKAYYVTAANYIFYPADCVFYGIAPPRWSLNTLPSLHN